jgi:hypothetical protein
LELNGSEVLNLSKFLIIRFPVDNAEDKFAKFADLFTSTLQPVLQQVCQLSNGVHFATVAGNDEQVLVAFVYDDDEMRFIEYLRVNLEGFFRELLSLGGGSKSDSKNLDSQENFQRLIEKLKVNPIGAPSGEGDRGFVYRAFGDVSVTDIAAALSSSPYPYTYRWGLYDYGWNPYTYGWSPYTYAYGGWSPYTYGWSPYTYGEVGLRAHHEAGLRAHHAGGSAGPPRGKSARPPRGGSARPPRGKSARPS